MITITLGDKAREVHEGASVLALAVEVLGEGDLRGVAIAINDGVLPKAAWSTTPLAEGDRVEIVSATQGG